MTAGRNVGMPGAKHGAISGHDQVRAIAYIRTSGTAESAAGNRVQNAMRVLAGLGLLVFGSLLLTGILAIPATAAQWEPQDVPMADLFGVCGTDPGNIYAVGPGTILHYDGVKWSDASGYDPYVALCDLRGVWCDSMTGLVYPVGMDWSLGAATLLRGGPGYWEPVPPPTGYGLTGVWGTNTGLVYAVDQDGAIRRLSAYTWATMSSSGPPLFGIWGSAPNNIFAVGAGGKIRRYNGASWQVMTVPPSWLLLGVWGTAPNNVYAVGFDTSSGQGLVVRFDGATWSAVTGPSFDAPLNAIWGSGPADIFVVGEVGSIWHYDGSTWAPENSGVPFPLHGVWGTGSGDVYAVGISGTVLRRTAGSTEAPPVALGANITAQPDVPVNIGLQATDDGKPNPPGVLDYIITSLPSHGSLSDPGAGAITGVPCTLASHGSHVNYTSTSGYSGSDSFQFKANDGGTAPTGGDSNLATVGIVVGGTGHLYTAGAGEQGQLGIGIGTDANLDPALAGNVVMLAAGGHHVLTVRADGTVWGWGEDSWGQLGDGLSSYGTCRCSPVQTAGLTDVVTIAAADYHSLAVKRDGTLWAWGDNYYGKLGDGTTTTRHSPVQITTTGDWVSVAAGPNHSLGLKSNGTVWAWGDNAYGQLGDGTTTGHTTPQQLPVLTGIVAVAAGYGHNLAIRNDGTVYAWGYNASGQLGDGSTTNRLIPQPVPGLANINLSAAGASHSLAAGSNGALYAWGYNGYGQLGDGSNTPRTAPVQVPTLAGVTSLAAGYYHSVAVTGDGTAWGWGRNDCGQLGDGTINAHNTPAQMSGVGSVIATVTNRSYDSSYSLLLKPDGTVWACGSNRYGQLCDGTNTNRNNPTELASVTGIAAAAAGYSHSLAAKGDGTVWAWGTNSDGQLGDGTYTPRCSPVQVVGLSGVVSVKAGYYHSLAVKGDGTVSSWGANWSGQLGNGTGNGSATPVQPSGLTGVTAVAAGGYHSLALKSDGTVWAWGNNSEGELGNGTTDTAYSPVQIPGLTGVVAIAAGGWHSLAVKSDGTVWAWGYNGAGQLGNGTTDSCLSPVQVSGLTGATAVAAGANHSLALKAGGTVWAWGDNMYTQLGDGTTSQRTTPVQALYLTNAVGISAGELHSLAVKADGTAWVWGCNWNGQLGDGTFEYRWYPVQLASLSGVMDVAAGGSHSLFLATLDAPPVPHVAATWPGTAASEQTVARILVGFDTAVTHVSADDLVLSAGSVVGVQGSGKGPYLFTIAGLPDASITATLDGDIATAAGMDLPAYTWNFQNILPPQPPTDAQANPSVICLGDSSQLSATPGANGDTVEWFTDLCGGTQVEGGASPTVSPQATMAYYVRTKNSANGRISPCAAVPVTITVVSPPQTDLPVSSLATVVCPNSSTAITVGNSEAGVSYQLRAGDEPLGPPVAGTGGDIELPTGALAEQTTFNVLATRPPCASAQLIQTVTVTVDGTGPTVQSATPSDLAIVTDGLTSVQVTFSENVNNVEAADLTVNGAPATEVTGSGAGPYTFSGYAPVADGWVSVVLSAGSIHDGCGNPATGASWSVGKDADSRAPQVSSQTPAANSDVATFADVQVTFSEYVTGVSAGDLTVEGSPATLVTGSGAGPYTFTGFAQPPDGDRTVALAAGSISDLSGRPFEGATWVYHVDTVAPQVASIARAGGSPTNAAEVVFTVTFSEPVNGGNEANFSLAADGITGAAIVSVTGSGGTRTVTVNTGTSDGTLRLDAVDATGMADAAGNLLIVPFAAGETYVVDKTPPAIVVGDPSPEWACLSGEISYTVTYTGADTVTLGPADVFLNTTGTATGEVVVSGAGNQQRVVTVRNLSGSGALGISIAPGTASDLATNSAPPAGPSVALELTTVPETPVPGLPSVDGQAAITWTWTGVQNADGYRVKDTGGSQKSPDLPPQAGEWQETGLAANTQYERVVISFDQCGESADSMVVSAWTLSVPPAAESVTPDTTSPCAGSDVIWAAAAGFGEGAVAKYRYAFNQDPAYAINGSEPEWSGGTLTTTCAGSGTWYLHVQGYNAADVPNGTYSYAIATAAPADFNCDGHVDADDLAAFNACVSGPMIAHNGTPACRKTDLDGDGDVDQEDFGLLQRCYTGSGQLADPNCGG